MASIGSLIVSLSAKTGTLETDLGRAARIAKRRAAEIDKALSNFGKVLGQGAAIATAALAALAKRSINTADDLSKMAQRSGIAVESLSAIKLGADLGGSSVESFGRGIQALTRNMLSASQGSKEQADAFRVLGISLTDSTGQLRNTEDVFRDVADLFQRLPDGTTKAAIAMRLFGKSGAELIPLLNGGSDGLDKLRDRAEKLGLLITTETAKAAEQFNDNLQILGGFATAVGNSMASDLLPSLVAITDQMTQAQEESDAFGTLGKTLADTFRAVAAVLATAATGVKNLTVVLTFAVQQAARLQKLLPPNLLKAAVNNLGGTSTNRPAPGEAPRSGGLSGFGDDISPGVAGARAELEALGETITDNNDALQTFFDSLFDPPQAKGSDPAKPVRDVAEATDDLQQRIKALLENQTEAASVQKSVDDATKSLSAILRDQSSALDDELTTATRAYADTLTELLRVQEALTAANQLDAGAIAQLAEARAGALRTLQQTKQDAAVEGTLKLVDEDDAQSEGFRASRDDLEFELSLQRLTNKEREVAITLRNANVTAMSAEGQELTKLVQQLQVLDGQNAAFDALSQGAANFVVAIASGTQSVKGSFKSLGSFLKDTFLRQLTQNLQSSLFSALGSLGGGGGLFGSLLSGIGSFFGGGRAIGGPVEAGKLFRVNEAEDEFFKPNGNGQVIPLSKMGSAGLGGVTQQFNFPIAFPPQLEAFVRNVAAPAGRDAAEQVLRANRGRL